MTSWCPTRQSLSIFLSSQPDFVIATRVLAGYAQYGLVPQPTPTTDVPIFLQRIPRQQETDLARLGWPKAAEMAYNAAGWDPEDVQFAEVYDSYAAIMAIGLEGLGLCKPGEGARFIAGETSPGGSLPSNTNGGLLSAGHTGVGGGTALLAEAVRQLLGRAGPQRQLPGVRRAVVGGTGGSYMDAQVMLLERVQGGAK